MGPGTAILPGSAAQAQKEHLLEQGAPIYLEKSLGFEGSGTLPPDRPGLGASGVIQAHGVQQGLWAGCTVSPERIQHSH